MLSTKLLNLCDHLLKCHSKQRYFDTLRTVVSTKIYQNERYSQPSDLNKYLPIRINVNQLYFLAQFFYTFTMLKSCQIFKFKFTTLISTYNGVFEYKNKSELLQIIYRIKDVHLIENGDLSFLQPNFLKPLLFANNIGCLIVAKITKVYPVDFQIML